MIINHNAKIQPPSHIANTCPAFDALLSQIATPPSGIYAKLKRVTGNKVTYTARGHLSRLLFSCSHLEKWRKIRSFATVTNKTH